MSDHNERAKFSLADGRIEIEGSETFVAAQLGKLEPLLARMFEQRPSPSAPSVSAATAQPPSSVPPAVSAPAGFDEYLNVFALADGKVQILKSLPGNGKSGKTMSAALLLAFANELNGTKATTVDEIRTTCTSHACLDAPNFAKIFRNAAGKESFTSSGSGGSQSVSLTHPGRVKAKALADSLNK